MAELHTSILQSIAMSPILVMSIPVLLGMAEVVADIFIPLMSMSTAGYRDCALKKASKEMRKELKLVNKNSLKTFMIVTSPRAYCQAEQIRAEVI
jgi:hypothetical protein